MTVCMQHPFWNGVSGNPQQTMSLVCKMTFKQIVEMLFQCFQKALEQHWNNLFEGNLAELGYVFAYFFRDFFVICISILRSIVLVISRSVFFLTRRQSYEGVL